jgi:hypothetical protein
VAGRGMGLYGIGQDGNVDDTFLVVQTHGFLRIAVVDHDTNIVFLWSVS